MAAAARRRRLRRQPLHAVARGRGAAAGGRGDRRQRRRIRRADRELRRNVERLCHRRSDGLRQPGRAVRGRDVLAVRPAPHGHAADARCRSSTFSGYPGEPAHFTNTHVTADPRFSLRYKLTERVALKGAIGLYTQPPAADALSRVFGNPDLEPQRATHYRGRRRRRHHHHAARRDGRILEGHAQPGRPRRGPGRSRAGERRARARLRRRAAGRASNCGATCSAGWRTRCRAASARITPARPWHRYVFDQTNILTLLASYRLPRGFQVGARFRYVTGNPYTPVTGAYFDSNADRYVPISGAPFSARLPAFNQLDLRVDKIWTFDRWRFSAYLDLQNTTRATNPEALSYNFDFTVSAAAGGSAAAADRRREGGFLMTARVDADGCWCWRSRPAAASPTTSCRARSSTGRACWRSRPSRPRCRPAGAPPSPP